MGRTCFRRKIKPWLGDDTEVWVRYYRGGKGAPSLRFPHIFGQSEMWDNKPPFEPGPGEPGEVPFPRHYDKGRLPTVYAPNGSFVGTRRQWVDGSVRGRDPVLTPTRVGSTLECLAQLGIRLRLHRWGQMVDGQQQ